MTIDEAIEIKEAYLRGDEPDDPLDLIRADRLGIAALKRCKYADRINFDGTINLLPGETEE